MIRKADERDIPRLAELFEQLHEFHIKIRPDIFKEPPDGFYERKICEILEKMYVFVNADNACGINGYAAVKLTDVDTEDRYPRKVCFIDCIAVDESKRRSGVGTALFGHIKAFARDNNCDAVQLGVNADNLTARAFYERMGLAPRTIIMDIKIGEENGTLR